MFKIITHRPLWVNFLAGLVLAAIIFFVFLSSLKCLTGHGKASKVPSVTGMHYDEAKKVLKKAGFSVDIMDSVYVDTARPMTVLKQLPDAEDVVKTGRTIILIISRAVPPLVEMPNLVGYSLRNAEMVLKSLDLKIGDTTFKPDFAKNAILEQWYNGQQIAPGTPIRKGSVLSLVLGDGIGKKEFIVPDITGMSFCDAKEMLGEHGIIIGAIVTNTDVEDTCSAYIFKQNPERFDDEKRYQRIRSGQTMDVWLQVNKPAKDSTKKVIRDEPRIIESEDAGYN